MKERVMKERVMIEQSQCPMESGIIAAAASGTLTITQQTHAGSCPVCRGSLSVSSVMTGLGQTLGLEKHLSVDARVLWYRAKFSKRRERVSLLDVISLWMMSFAGVCATLILIWINYPALSAKVTSLGMTLLPGSVSLTVVFGGLGGILFLLWLFTLDVFLAER